MHEKHWPFAQGLSFAKMGVLLGAIRSSQSTNMGSGFIMSGLVDDVKDDFELAVDNQVCMHLQYT